jgi:hypothetical protein
MGTTIDDILQEQAEEENYRQKEMEQAISERKANPLTEQASEIHNYLPISRNTIEDEYIDHLWDAFLSLDTLGDSGRGFSIMPFHLLFILSLHYKILRIAKFKKTTYKNAFLLQYLNDEASELPTPKSVYTLGLLEESKMVNLFKIIGVKNDLVGQIKALVKNRNDNLGHAKGGIESNIEKRVDEYLNILVKIQPYFESFNNSVARKWFKDMEPGEAGVEYIQLHLAEEYLCPVDMQTGELSKLDQRLNEKANRA